MRWPIARKREIMYGKRRAGQGYLMIDDMHEFGAFCLDIKALVPLYSMPQRGF